MVNKLINGMLVLAALGIALTIGYDMNSQIKMRMFSNEQAVDLLLIAMALMALVLTRARRLAFEEIVRLNSDFH